MYDLYFNCAVADAAAERSSNFSINFETTFAQCHYQYNLQDDSAYNAVWVDDDAPII